MKKLNAVLAGLLLGAFLMLLIGYITAQDRQYTLKGTTEQMIALRKAVEQTTMPHNEANEVEKWLNLQLYQQDLAFAKADSVSKAKGAK